MDAKNKWNLFCNATFRPFGPCQSLWMELTCFSCRVLHLPLLGFMSFLSVYFCSLSRSLSEGNLCLCVLTTGFLIKTWNDIGLSVDPWGMLLQPPFVFHLLRLSLLGLTGRGRVADCGRLCHRPCQRRGIWCHAFPLLYKSSHFIMGDYQGVSQTPFTLDKSMQAVPTLLISMGKNYCLNCYVI